MIKKVDFRKGNGTFIYGIYIMMITLLIALVCIEQFSMYNNAFNTQIAADAIADGTAVYMANNDATYEEAMENTNVIKELLEEYMGIKISNIKIDKNDLENNDLVSVELTANYHESSNIDDFSGNGNLKNNYDITRHSATSFIFGHYANGDYIWPLDDDMVQFTSVFSHRKFINGSGCLQEDNHKGVDIVGYNSETENRNIYAIADGTVVAIQTTGDTYIKIYHGQDSSGNYIVSQYTHWNSYAHGLKVGDDIKKGDIIAYVGNRTAGSSSGNHLDFKVYFAKDDRTFFPYIYVNPLIYCYGISSDGGYNLTTNCEIPTANDTTITKIYFSANHDEEDALKNMYYKPLINKYINELE